MINSVFLIRRRQKTSTYWDLTLSIAPHKAICRLLFSPLPGCGPSSSEHTSLSSLVFSSGFCCCFLLVCLFVCFNLPPYLWFCPLTYPLWQMASTAQVLPGLSSREASPEQSPGSPAPKRGSGQTNPSVHLLVHPTTHASIHPSIH